MLKNTLNKQLSGIIQDVDIYESYVNALDYPGKIDKIITPIVKDKTILNLEIGNLKYLKFLAPITYKTIGIDVLGEKENKIKNVDIMNLDEVEDESIDIVMGYWFFSKFENIDSRNKFIASVKKKLKKGGEIYLIENDNISEFEEITGKYQIQPNPTLLYNTWLMNEIGFNIFYRIETFFKFDNTTEAQKTFSSLRGAHVGEKIKNRTIQQRIIIFKYQK